MADTRVTELPDGRELAWVEVGDPDGPAVFVFHGTPGSRLTVTFMKDAIAASGARVIAPDRPGYGHSTFHRGRQLTDWPGDVAYLADHLGLDRFSVVGISGGGPHAAVCAYGLAERVTAAGIVSGVGLLSDPQSLEGMMAANRLLSRLSGRSMQLARPIFGAQVFVARRWPAPALRTAAEHLPEADGAIMSRPEVQAAFIEESMRASATTALAGAQDFSLFARDWGFRLEDITVLVHVWHGDADRNVPFAQGRRQAELIPGATFHACPGEGHLLVVDHVEEILRTVTPS